MIEEVLITVKTYPTLSASYGELVCTAGFTRDGRFIRIYPIPFRKLERELKYEKYQWVTFDLEKNTKDFRPESYRIRNHETISTGKKIETDGGTWYTRRQIILRNVYTNLTRLIEEAKDSNKRTSLAVFKPTKITGFRIKEVEREWDKEKMKHLQSQGDLFDPEPFEIVDKLPYKFTYTFEDEDGRESTLMNEDWEIGRLYWNCLKSHNGDERVACENVRKKYWDDFAKTKDLYFYLGTTQKHHNTAPNPFIIIGTIYPKRQSPDLFGISPTHTP